MDCILNCVLNKEEIDIIRDVMPLAETLCRGLPVYERIAKACELIKDCGNTVEPDTKQKEAILLLFTLQELSFMRKYNVLSTNYGIELNDERLKCIAQTITLYGSYTEEKKLKKAEMIKKLKAKDKTPSRKLYISDLHFFHERLNQSMDKRGFESLAAMHSYMIKKWKDNVTAKDEVYIIGDFSVARGRDTNAIIAQLPGKKYLVRGNHDKFLDDKVFDQSLFEWILPYVELQDNKRKVILSHYPVFCYNGQYRRTGETPSTYMLYGHVHDTHDEKLINKFIMETRRTKVTSRYDPEPKPIPCQMINCFCMFSDYVPLTLDEWIMIDEERRKHMSSD